MSKKLFIKKVFSISIVIMISMLLLSVKEEAKTQYDSLTFDAEYYINVYPDIKNAFGNDYQSAYDHFMTFGIKEGRKGSPYFDVYYYLNQNSDLQKAFGSNYELAYNHFVYSGINENRAGSPYIDSAITNAYGND